MAEWKATRHDWINEIAATADQARTFAISAGARADSPSSGEAAATETEDAVALENEWYRVEVDKQRGGVRSLFDKKLGRELAGSSGPYLLGQYVAVARGENAGLRGVRFSRPGFRKVLVEAIEIDGRAVARISGKAARHRDQVSALSDFVDEALGIKIPDLAVRVLARVLKIRLGPVDKVTQEIELRPGDPVVHFTSRFQVSRDQAIDHTIAYPLHSPPERPLIVEGPYNPYRFAPAPPLGHGDLIGAARMTDADFPGINDLTQVFAWIYGMPADAGFRSYVLAQGDGYGIAFSARESGMIFPGPLDQDPAKGPFGGGFFHLALGWTAYGHAFLGAPREIDFTVRGALASFAAADERDARAQAARFGHDFTSAGVVPGFIDSSNPDVMVTVFRPLADGSYLMRLYETSGREARTVVTISAGRSIARAVRARSDGVELAGSPLEVRGESFTVTLGPAEAATVRLDFD